VTEYAKGATGNVAPVATITGPHTGLARPESLALDAAGNLFVANSAGSSVTEYAKGANGDAAPIATIKGPKTKLGSPHGVTIAHDGEHLRMPKAGAETVVVHPNRRGRQLIAHHGRVAIRLSVAYTPQGSTRQNRGSYRVLITGSDTPPGLG
jgi:hypothetical protein